MEGHHTVYWAEARQKWDRARRKAFWNQLLAAIEGEEPELLDFGEVSRRLHLKNAVYRGRQMVPLDKIVGSLGRYQDFTGAFLPVSEDMGERWRRIAALYLDPTGPGVPPVELYKVGDAYFVKDGNHRVSVAHQLGMPSIEAYVWEYPEPVAGLPTDADIHTLLLEAERRDFLEQTRLDELRPGHGIRLTELGGYTDLLLQIARFQDALSQIDGQPVPYEEAVTAWYDMVYETTVQLIQEAGVLDLFPDRTPADFFVWTKRHEQRLKERYQRQVRIGEVARQVRRRKRPPLWRRGWRALLRWLLRRLGG